MHAVNEQEGKGLWMHDYGKERNVTWPPNPGPLRNHMPGLMGDG